MLDSPFDIGDRSSLERNVTQTSMRARRIDLPLSDKILVIEELKRKKSQSQVAKKFGVSQPQVCRIWKEKDKYIAAHKSNVNPARKRNRKSTQTDVEQALLRWFEEANKTGLVINGPILQEKAADLAREMHIAFEPSTSWISRWRDRNGIVFKRKRSEKKDLLEAAGNWNTSVWPRIQEPDLSSDINNCDKTSLVHGEETLTNFDNDILPRSKKSKKLPMPSIGSDKPRLLVDQILPNLTAKICGKNPGNDNASNVETQPTLFGEAHGDNLRNENMIGVEGDQANQEICKRVLTDENSGANSNHVPQNKEVLDALDTIRRRLQFEGLNLDKFIPLEKQVQGFIWQNIK